MSYFGMRNILVGLSFFLISSIVIAEGPVASPQQFAVSKLREAGISTEMISWVEKGYIPEERDRIVEMNVLGFLGKADYSGHFSKRAVRKCSEFIRKYRKRLMRAEKSYGVSREAVASLLWVETKHGTHVGTFNVPQVFFSLIQSDHPEVMRSALVALSKKEPTAVAQYKQKVIDRSYAKANWAMQELKSLNEILKKRNIKMETLRGSYAGAFGIPQFIPSSYIQWARPSLKAHSPNLFDMSDAIQSVAFYLKSNGWNANDRKAQKDALFHYNRSEGYVEVILKLADELRKARGSS